jgi:hypothetical protein
MDIATKFAQFLGRKTGQALHVAYTPQPRPTPEPEHVAFIQALEPGFYWYKDAIHQAWEPVQVQKYGGFVSVYQIGLEDMSTPEELTGEWGAKIEYHAPKSERKPLSRVEYGRWKL